MWEDLFAALALLLVFEGITPFLNPAKWRQMILMVAQQPDRVLRMMGLISMMLGATLLFIVRGID